MPWTSVIEASAAACPVSADAWTAVPAAPAVHRQRSRHAQAGQKLLLHQVVSWRGPFELGADGAVVAALFTTKYTGDPDAALLLQLPRPANRRRIAGRGPARLPGAPPVRHGNRRGSGAGHAPARSGGHLPVRAHGVRPAPPGPRPGDAGPTTSSATCVVGPRSGWSRTSPTSTTRSSTGPTARTGRGRDRHPSARPCGSRRWGHRRRAARRTSAPAYVDEMVAMIGQLVEIGPAYPTDDGVYLVPSRSRTTACSPTSRSTRCSPEAASARSTAPSTSTIRPTSRSGSWPSRASRAGRRRGATAVRAGTPSAS